MHAWEAPWEAHEAGWHPRAHPWAHACTQRCTATLGTRTSPQAGAAPCADLRTSPTDEQAASCNGNRWGPSFTKDRGWKYANTRHTGAATTGAACPLHKGSAVKGQDASRCRSPGGSTPPGGGGPPGGGAPGGGLGPGTGPFPANPLAPGGAGSPAAAAGAPVAGTAAAGWPPELPSCPDLASGKVAAAAAGACCCCCGCAVAAWTPAAASPAAVPGAAGSSDCSGGACWAAPLAPTPTLAVTAAVDSSWLPVVPVSAPLLPVGGLLGLPEVTGGVASAAAAGAEAAGVEAGVTASRTAAGGGPDGGRGPGTAAAAKIVACSCLHHPLPRYGWPQGQRPS